MALEDIEQETVSAPEPEPAPAPEPEPAPAPEPEPAPAPKPVPIPQPKDDGKWKELGFKSKRAYDKYKNNFL